MEVPAGELADEVTYQIGALQAFARAAGADVAYVKPHGALYNRVVSDPEQAAAVASGTRLADPGLAVLCMPDSAMHRAARKEGLAVVGEAFADRAYTAAGTLVPRGAQGAVISDLLQVARQAVTLARDGHTTALTGEPVRIRARSLCLHGDTPGAVELAVQVRKALQDAGVRLEAFA
jgi:UPF0271 protein